MQIGKTTTLDGLGRITLNKEIWDLFMMDVGDKLIYYNDGGRIYIKKETALYGRFDFENDMIEERVKTYVKTMKMLDGSEFDDYRTENQIDDALEEQYSDEIEKADSNRNLKIILPNASGQGK